MTTTRLSRLAIAVLFSAFIAPHAVHADHLSAAVGRGNITVELQLVADGITSPLKVLHANDESGRLFIVDQVGLVWIVDKGVRLTEPFLDIRHLLPALSTSFDERGLLGLAFHPDFVNNGRLFARFSTSRPGNSNEPCFNTSRGCSREVVAEFGMNGNPNVADATATILFDVNEPQFNHNGGDINFGPDGYLYFALGDGGGSNDSLNLPNLPHGPLGNGQDINTALGAMIRIDVDAIPANAPYGIPGDNPFVGVDRLDEIYAYGLRNPYRFTFDRSDNRLILADVGQGLFEEVNIIERGGNYGWVTREGLHCFDPFDNQNVPANCADVGPLGEPLIDPIAEYDHGDGISITGGFVYRGTQSPLLVGKYIFGDFSRGFAPADGRIFYMDSHATAPIPIFEFLLADRGLPLAEYVIGFGEDEDGEGYVTTTTNLAPVDNAGRVYKIVESFDTDDDGVLDVDDNCSQVANPNQRDTDGDGFGNLCDPDLNQDNVVNAADLGILRLAFFSTPADKDWNADADFNGDDQVNAGDLGVLRAFFFAAPGPGAAGP